MKETVVMHSSQITQGKLGKVDISFLPKTVRPFSALTPELSSLLERACRCGRLYFIHVNIVNMDASQIQICDLRGKVKSTFF